MGKRGGQGAEQEPRMKKFTAEMKTRRVPNRSASQPLTGMSMATVRV